MAVDERADGVEGATPAVDRVVPLGTLHPVDDLVRGVVHDQADGDVVVA